MSKKKIHKKLKRKRYTCKKYKGGELIMNESTDLKNLHICKKASVSSKGTVTQTYKESPGYELYVAISEAFELNAMSKEFFLGTYTKENNKWFKFVIFDNNNKKHLFVINGAPINKHSVCMLQGLLDVTRKTSEYPDLREAYNKVIELKSVHGIETSSIEENEMVIYLNSIITRDIPCMPVISAGSGTVNDDGSVCINTKSGHYKPSLQSIEIAKTLFEEITGETIHVVDKISKDALKAKYGANYEQYSGICL
jgi:hypothetical protein